MKAIFQSLTFFTLATEMRFIEMNADVTTEISNEKDKRSPLRENNASPGKPRVS